MVRRLSAGGNRIRTIGPDLVEGLSAVADVRCRTDKLDGVIKHRSSREPTMVGRGASLDGRLFLGGTDGSNPVPSSGESTNHRFLGGGAALTPRPSGARRSIKPLPTTTSRAADLVLRNVLEGKPCDKTSTLDQVAGFEAQRRDLEAAGCTRIFAEQISSVADRPELAAALDYLRDEDTLVATKIDRLARSVPDLLDIVARTKTEGAKVEILNLGNLDPGSVNGKLILTVLGAIAAFEREMMLERQREGIARAKAEGKYKGRKPTARNEANQVRALAAEGVSKVEIARRLGMHRASVYRALAVRA